MTITVSTRAIGARRPLLADFSVPPPSGAGGEDLLLRTLIEHIVREQVRAFARRQSEQRFDRALTARQIEEGVQRGRVNPAGRDLAQEVDPDAAVGAALQAFEDGLYLAIIDEQERKSLDEVVRLKPDSRIVFVRLTMLAGA